MSFNPFIIMWITRTNYEEYFLLSIDGELDEAAERALQAFLQDHPDLRPQYDLLKNVKLRPDETIVFDSKHALLRPEPSVRRMSLRPYQVLSAAAGLALLLGFVFWWATRQSPVSVQTSIARKVQNRAASVASQTKAPLMDSLLTASKSRHTQSPKIGPKPPTTPLLAGAMPHPASPTRGDKTAHSIVQNAHTDQRPATTKEDEHMLAPLPTLPTQSAAAEVAITVLPDRPPLADAKPVAEQQTIDDERRHRGLLDDDKRAGIDLVKASINDRIRKARKVRESLRQTRFAINLGDKQIDLF